jgi:hypothetical protein
MRSTYELIGFGLQLRKSFLRRKVMPGSILSKTVRIALGVIHLGVTVFDMLLPREERHMDEICCLAFCCISSTIVAGRRRHALVANHLLYSGQVGAGIK